MRPGLLALLTPAILVACGPKAGQTLPEQVTLKNVGHEEQRLNNCGPVNAMIVMNYYGHELTQNQAEKALKDSPQDVEVSTRELAEYAQTFGLNTLIRYAGDTDVVRALLAKKYRWWFSSV